ncbi:ribosomal L7Ae/L30e/S12e/Gadd45 family protein [Paenibacillus sp. GCM10012307]|uniref:Ribosomal L7Ae/L30e/S12e/Gadd45 family protein n=1 Tax=Paenibacillus roseus TaxID=2798579 RepID=A0A934J601_9BACL|nr:ribosomal L7Ae/L30e/S12e/Gadd45 family protein [Paenibacillus roseus]MBJ6361025.1 ribosomal L7Ae/L30e/S12e/Gadd45 family protein [Paenibacillus roseus]
MAFKIGTKQTAKAVEQREAAAIYVAEDADPQLTHKVVQISLQAGIDVIRVDTMKNLGIKCGIEVGAAMAAWIPDEE